MLEDKFTMYAKCWDICTLLIAVLKDKKIGHGMTGIVLYLFVWNVVQPLGLASG